MTLPSVHARAGGTTDTTRAAQLVPWHIACFTRPGPVGDAAGRSTGVGQDRYCVGVNDLPGSGTPSVGAWWSVSNRG